MSTLTKEWLLKTIAELEEERDAVPGVVNEDAARALAAMKLALASLEAEHAGFIVKHKVTGKFGSWLHSKADWFRSDEYEVLSAYTAPPAPASVPDVVSWEDVPEEITEDDIALASAWAHGFNQCRAAMLQGAEPDFREISNSSTKHFRENAETSTKCWCRTCRPVTFADSHFVVCPECGNKRCPHANDHRHACTGSNEPVRKAARTQQHRSRR